MLKFSDFTFLIEKDGSATLELSMPQKSGEDAITGEFETAKVLHYSFSLPAGYTCPFATECRSRTVPSGKMHRGNHVGKVLDGPLCKFRCFAASNEGIYADARAVRNRNFESLSGINVDDKFGDITANDNKSKINTDMDQLDAEFRGDESEIGDTLGDITHSIHNKTHIRETIIRTINVYKNRIVKTGPKFDGDGGVMRVHVSGDFYSQAYFDAWMEAAKVFQPDGKFPGITFYAYTKSIPYWINSQDLVPENFKLNASYGGKHDDMIRENKLKFAKVCFSKALAENYPFDVEGNLQDGAQMSYIDSTGTEQGIKGLHICEEDDAPAYATDAPFALLLHGTQPKDSEAATSIAVIKNDSKNETLNKRIAYFMSQGDDELTAQIKVPVYMTAFSNVSDLKKKKDKSIAGRIVKLQNQIAVILYKAKHNTPEDEKVTTTDAKKEFRIESVEYTEKYYPEAERFYKNKMGMA